MALPYFLFCFLFVDERMASRFLLMLYWLLPSFPTIVDSTLWNTMLKQTLSSLRGFCHGVYHGSRKVTNTCHLSLNRKVPDTWPSKSKLYYLGPFWFSVSLSSLQVFPLPCSSQRQRSEHLPFLEINTTATNRSSDLASSAPDIRAGSFHLAFLTNGFPPLILQLSAPFPSP